jgi:L-rhamnose mutarotase
LGTGSAVAPDRTGPQSFSAAARRDGIVVVQKRQEESMKRVAFKMQLTPGNEAEYKRRHDQVWPELVRELEAAGITDYSIFLDRETGTLFALQHVKDHNSTDELPKKQIMRKWWDHMADLMETNRDNSPVVKPLEEVFHMD